MKTFGECLKELRVERGISQRELAKAIEVGNAAVSHWENNTYEITASNLVKVAKYFGVTCDFLLGLKDC